ncbi:MAG TPA: IPT/TIG domain-containing protein [Bacteroidales bacterium]|nr:IPT/TIG domain-containing protein [Bacteroidales bacterium]
MNIKDLKLRKSRILLPVFLFIIAFILVTCEENPVPREYPQLSETTVSNITDTGAYFSANLFSMGDETIIRTGFIWSYTENTNPDNCERVFLDAPQHTGIFSTSVSTALRREIKYYVRSLVQTEKRTVYGPSTRFTSNGSKGPTITDFTPDKAGWGDTIKITGKNFSYYSSKVFVNNTIPCHVVEANDSTIYTLLSPGVATNDIILSVEVSEMKATLLSKKLLFIPPCITDFHPKQAYFGDTITIRGKYLSTISANSNYIAIGNIKHNTILASDTLLKIIMDPRQSILNPQIKICLNSYTFSAPAPMTLLLPVINNYSPKQAHWGDTITIKGNHFKTFALNNSFVSLGNIKCKTTLVHDTLIKLVIDPKVNNINNELNASLNGLVSSASEQFTLLPPPAITFEPSEGTWNSRMKITGKFYPSSLDNKILFDSIAAPIQSITTDSIIVKVPPEFRDSICEIIYKVGPFSIPSEKKFRLYPTQIKSFNPSSGAGGTKVTIKGKYFNPTIKATVNFGETTASIVSQNDSIIVVSVPSNISGPVRISVRVGSQKVVFNDVFTITNPLITSILPVTGTFNNLITINGANFNSTVTGMYVYFGNYPGEIVSTNLNRIIAKVPIAMDSIPVKIRLYVSNNYALSQESFTLDPHIINSTSGAYSPGGELHIFGNNFNPDPSKNIVKWDSYRLKVKSSTPNEIVAEWGYLPNGNYKIMVETGGYKRYSNDLITVNSAWTRIPSPKISTNTIQNQSGSINNMGYVLNIEQRTTFTFNPVDKSWTQLNIDFPVWYNIYQATNLVLNDTLYVLSYYYASCYDPSNNKWRNINLGLNNDGTGFALNNRIWYGLGNYSSQFYEIDPSNGYSNTIKGNFPTTVPGQIASSFTISGKGYVVFSNNQVWQFDPTNLAWQRKNNFPGKQRTNASSFVIGNYAYFGLGSYNLDDIWKYDPINDVWSLKTRIPIGRQSATAFVINNKAYLGFGVGTNGSLYDFYEFDPSF